ncbi:TauD/TfdA family dioxygenase [Aquihabitans sp. G128]|uniref:TauD/TfdA dioxygenase family protein n=1 Tax=Aquihabitans sp. G128 TaxID=2849779 RepID=UPI001C2223FF|nr:TauD/TfdA family dioxygenase [Aquihabitans sp. G128]QXC61147.1 TauD/TfdA family dioxygenase [Aquihabitans sp. G128]
MPTSTARPAFTVDRLTTAIGAVVPDLDLQADLPEDEIERLRDVLAERQVLFFRDQHLDEAALVALASRFGTLSIHPVSRLLGRTPTTSVIEDSAERPPAGFDWHTDLSWTAAPPALGFLTALHVPPVGGDTLWASGFELHDRLDPALAALCRTLQVEHRPDAALLATIRRHHGDEVARQVEAEHPPVSHPLVRRHERTGRPALWLSPLYGSRLLGIDPVDGRRLLDLLHAKVDDAAVQVRWRWSAGDVAIWDESSTTHRALTDHHPHLRRMRRCTTDGRPPMPAGQAPVPTT